LFFALTAVEILGRRKHFWGDLGAVQVLLA
jgi:hypothetical protein